MHKCIISLLGLSVASVFASTPAPNRDWPQWRGPDRTGYAKDGPAITSLPKELKPVWKIDVGGGFAAPVVQGNALIYVDENGSREFAHRIDAATGKEVWKIDRKSDAVGVSREAYASPCLWNDGQRTSLVVLGCDYATGHRLEDGGEIWRLGGLNPKAKYDAQMQMIQR